MSGKSVTQGWHIVEAAPGPYHLPDPRKLLICDSRGIDMTHACQVVAGSHLTAQCLGQPSYISLVSQTGTTHVYACPIHPFISCFCRQIPFLMLLVHCHCLPKRTNFDLFGCDGTCNCKRAPDRRQLVATLQPEGKAI
jgi:hypothetical protein